MRVSTTLRATVAAVAAAALVALLPPAPAWSHTTLVASDPADGATVTTAVSAITFTFNGGVKQQFSTVVVTGADGVSYSDGTPNAVEATLTQAVKPLPAGAVKVAWRTVSADGHPIEGAFSFTNAAADARTPSSATVSVQAEPAADDSGSSGLLRAVVGGGAVLVLAGGAVLWRRRSGAGRSG